VTEFFGISMTWIMAVLLALFALSLASVIAVALRNRVLFRIGLRNIPRRPAQSLLIVLGLMLSTVIIAAAFAIGDTVSYSVTNDAYNKLGRVDELVRVRESRQGAELTEEAIQPAGAVPKLVIDGLTADLNGNDDVDGILPMLRVPAPVSNHIVVGGPQSGVVTQAKLNQPKVSIVGLDPNRLAGFEDDIVADRDGTRADITQMSNFDAVVNTSLGKALQLYIGDRIDIWVDRQPKTFTVVGFVRDDFLTGWTRGEPSGVVVRLSTLQKLLGTQAVNLVAISNRGEVRDSLEPTGRVTAAAIDSIGSSRFEVDRTKQARIDKATELGSNMTAIFVVLGLFSIAAGLLLVFLILVMLAAERRPEMGMSRAIGMTRRQLIESFMAEGMAFSVTSAAVGAALGVLISLGMTRVMSYIFSSFDVDIAFHVTARSLVVAYCVGVVLTFVTVVVSAWRVSKMSIVEAIREVNESPHRASGRASGAAGAGMALAGAALIALGWHQHQAYLFGGGGSLIGLGAAFVSRMLGHPARLVFTATGLAVLVLWGLVAGNTLEPITGALHAGVETFFVAGVLMVAAATFVVIYNAELLLGSVRAVGFVFARAVPAVRTAVAYPLADKFRTGMTIAMMSLVVFALVMISTMNLNFRRLFLSSDSRGGWDIEVSELPTNTFADANGNKLGPLGEALDRAFYPVRKIDTIAQVYVGSQRSTQIAQLREDNSAETPHAFPILGADKIFLEQNTIGLQARAQGYATDRAVWDAVRDEPNAAVIDGSVVPGINYANLTESRFTLDGHASGTREFAPFPLLVQDTSTTKQQVVKVIGIMNRGPSETFAGLVLNQDAFNKALPPQFSRYYVRLQPGNDANAEAQAIESTLAQQGISAQSIRQHVEDQQRLSSAFFYLLQGFMALGLGVGLAALGVIAFRTVVERRQQVGLMRAIGFSRANIALSFVLESAFISLLGIVNGIWLALLLSNRLLASDDFKTAGFTAFYVPWLQIVLMAVGVFVASVLTTLIPSRQASSVPIAEALRYE